MTKGWSQVYSPEVWHNGRVILSSNDTVYGKVKYSFEDDLIFLRNPQTTHTYFVKKINEVNFTDSITGNTRTFKRFFYQTSDDYAIPILFEVMEEGALNFLTRDMVEVYTSASSFNDGFLNTYKEHNVYMYYLKGDMVEPLPSKKKQFLKIFDKEADKVENYLSENKLKIYSRMDVKMIFEYYNSIK